MQPRPDASGQALSTDPAPAGSVNVARLLVENAARFPERLAVRRVQGRRIEDTTYQELEQRVARLARGLAGIGVEPGTRVSLFVRPGADLIALTYALLALGALPVLIDPGMGRKALLGAIERARPEVLIGVRRALFAGALFPRAFQSVRRRISVDGPFPGATPLDRLAAGPDARLEVRDTRAEDPAAVLFTSGSTGPAKGVLTNHGILFEQVQQLRALYGLGDGEVDLCCFPLFALFDTALGGTSVFPEIDPSRPARCVPERVRFAIEATGASLAFGSPAIWRRMLSEASDQRSSLRPLRRVLIAGAPVPLDLIERLKPLLAEGGEVHTPYGATECLPVSSISGSELLEPEHARKNRFGQGNCIGRPAPRVSVRVVPVTEGVIQDLEALEQLPAGALGELLVTGPTVTPLYLDDPVATRAAKIRAADGRLWHRMGDLARQDEQGELWFLGRVAHRLETDQGTYGCVEFENAFEGDPRLRHVAVVGLGPRGREQPHLILEPAQKLPATQRTALLKTLFQRARERSPLASRIAGVLFHKAFPVDVRHNAKIHRGELKRWAATELQAGRMLAVPSPRET